MSISHDPHRRTLGDRTLHPESLMMSYGHSPLLAEGALKGPIFQTSTFVFKSAEDGKAFFELAHGLRERQADQALGLLYSHVNHPDLEILEERLTLWDAAEEAALFSSGMAAISTTLLTFLRPGDVILHSEPIYGGTAYLLKHILPRFGIRAVAVPAEAGSAGLVEALEQPDVAAHVGLLLIETPASPTNALVDIRSASNLLKRHARSERPPLVAVDNTLLGPLWQHPLDHGADLVLYSATKYLGGHSDLVAGVTLGRASLIERVKGMRTILGTASTPWTGWLLMRSLETLKLRMTSQMKNARYVANFLADHPLIERVHYLGHLTEDDPGYEVYRKQCLSPGGMLAFEIVGGEAEAFRFLNALQLFQLAVDMGGTESLAEHPASMTHSDVGLEGKQSMGIPSNMIRLSIGVEHPEDLIADLAQALAQVGAAAAP